MVKKLVALAVIAGGAAFAFKRNADAKSEAQLWREATSPEDLPSAASNTNGTTSTTTPSSEN